MAYDLLQLGEIIETFRKSKEGQIRECVAALNCEYRLNGFTIESKVNEPDDLEHEREAEKFKMLIGNALRPAVPVDYLGWLKEFILAGNNPTHYCDVHINAYISDFQVATKDFRVSPLHSHFAKHIIVPYGIRFQGDLGHTNLYMFDGTTLPIQYASSIKEGPIHIGEWAPVFKDTKFDA